MSKQSETNKKLPKPAAATVDGEYPYVYAERTTNGRSYVRHDNPNKPNESFESTMSHDGSYSTKQISSSYNGLSTKLQHEIRDYVRGGSSSHVDGHKDSSVDSTLNENIKGDMSHATGANHYTGAIKTIGGSKEGSFEIVPGGKKYSTTQGDIVQKFVGNQTLSIEGNDVSSTDGTKVMMVDGEFAVHVQGSHNFDQQVGGKVRLKSGDDMLLTSDTKITLKVGTSEIIIQSSQITIKSSAIYFVKV